MTRRSIMTRDALAIGHRRAWAIAIILAALSTFSFLDRQVLALLVPDLRRELHMTDIQFGVLSGPAFIIVYNAVLIPASLLVDRWNRKLLIVTGALIWTSMTIASGFAQSYHQLLALRGGLAFGEALLGPAAIALIGDLFERADRPLPTATYIAGSVIGTTGSAMLSAAMLQLAGWLSVTLPQFSPGDAWRLTLIGVGIPGLLLGLLLLVVGREPARSQDRTEDHAATDGLVRHLRGRGLLYAGIFLGYGMLSIAVTALATWGPTHIITRFGLTQVHAGYLLGGASLLGGVAGTLILPKIFRGLIRSGDVGRIPLIAIGAILVLIAGALIGGTTTTLALCLLGFGIVMFCAMGVGTLPTLTIQLYAPSHLRGRISASLFFSLYLLSIGIGPVLVPLIAGGMAGAGALGNAIALVSAVCGGIAAILFVLVRRPLLGAEAAIRTDFH